MAIIKQSNAGDIARDAVVLDLGDLQRQAALIVQAARDQAAATIAEAQRERARIVAGAAEAGRLEGLEAGRIEGVELGAAQGREQSLAEMRNQLEQVQSAWTAAVDKFESARAGLLDEAGREMIRLALQIAEKLTKRVIQADPSVVVDQLAAVLAMVVRPSQLIVRIHPDDESLVREALPVLAARFAMAQSIELLTDASLTRGSCTAAMRGDQGGGEVDATISSQLDRIVAALLPDDGGSSGSS